MLKKINFSSLILFSIILTIVLSSCGSPVKINGSTDFIKTSKKMALIEFVIGNHSKAEIPGWDILKSADMLFNEPMSQILPSAQKSNASRVDTFNLYLGSKLNKYLKFKVLYGKELTELTNYSNLKNSCKTYDVSIEQNRLRDVNIPSNFYNYFDFHGVDNQVKFFEVKEFPSYKENIVKICKELDVEGVIVGATCVELEYRETPTPFVRIPNWYRENHVILVFFDKNGNKMLDVSTQSEATTKSEAASLYDYEQHIDKFYYNSDFMLQVLMGLKPNSVEKVNND